MLTIIAFIIMNDRTFSWLFSLKLTKTYKEQHQVQEQRVICVQETEKSQCISRIPRRHDAKPKQEGACGGMGFNEQLVSHYSPLFF